MSAQNDEFQYFSLILVQWTSSQFVILQTVHRLVKSTELCIAKEMIEKRGEWTQEWPIPYMCKIIMDIINLCDDIKNNHISEWVSELVSVLMNEWVS